MYHFLTESTADRSLTLSRLLGVLIDGAGAPRSRGSGCSMSYAAASMLLEKFRAAVGGTSRCTRSPENTSPV